MGGGDLHDLTLSMTMNYSFLFSSAAKFIPSTVPLHLTLGHYTCYLVITCGYLGAKNWKTACQIATGL